MNRFGLIVATVILLVAVGPGYSQTFVISSGGEYDYVPPVEGPGIPGCQPNQFLCEFGISGMVTVTADATSLVFNGADFTLTGNEAIQNDPDFGFGTVTGEDAAALLVGDSLALVSDVGGVQTYQSDASFSSLIATIDGDELQVTGGRDITFIDGDAYDFNFTATPQAVPEPATAALLSMGILSTLLRRRRKLD